MVKKIELKERNAANDGWEDIYHKTSSDLVLDEATNKTVKTRLEEMDTLLGTHGTDIESIETELTKRVHEDEKGTANGVATLRSDGSLVQLPYEIGNYSGSGAASRTINLGFRPKMVLIMALTNNSRSVGFPKLDYEFYTSADVRTEFTMYSGMFIDGISTTLTHNYDNLTASIVPFTFNNRR